MITRAQRLSIAHHFAMACAYHKNCSNQYTPPLDYFSNQYTAPLDSTGTHLFRPDVESFDRFFKEFYADLGSMTESYYSVLRNTALSAAQYLCKD